MNKYLKTIIQNFEFSENLKNKAILITGGTGLIGSSLIEFIEAVNQEYKTNITIYATARNKEKTANIKYNVNWLYISLVENLPNDLTFDYIFHTACPTQSSYLVNNPVEVINDTICGAKNLFEYSKRHGSKVIYLSSIEIYGQKFDDVFTKEDDYGYVNHMNTRSSYPASKRLIECLAKSYAVEYGVDIKIARLTQTIGPNISKNDNRVFVQFANSILNQEDIILHTAGKSSKNYIHLYDAINGLFYILLLGLKGEAYNIANENTYISIADLAQYVINQFNPNVKLKFEMNTNLGYAPDTKIKLDTSKLTSLGWKCYLDLYDMFASLIEYIKTNN